MTMNLKRWVKDTIQLDNNKLSREAILRKRYKSPR